MNDVEKRGKLGGRGWVAFEKSPAWHAWLMISASPGIFPRDHQFQRPTPRAYTPPPTVLRFPSPSSPARPPFSPAQLSFGKPIHPRMLQYFMRVGSALLRRRSGGLSTNNNSNYRNFIQEYNYIISNRIMKKKTRKKTTPWMNQ